MISAGQKRRHAARAGNLLLLLVLAAALALLVPDEVLNRVNPFGNLLGYLTTARRDGGEGPPKASSDDVAGANIDALGASSEDPCDPDFGWDDGGNSGRDVQPALVIGRQYVTERDSALVQYNAIV